MLRWLEHRIPPPVIDLACIGLMWLLARALPAAQLWSVGAYPFGVGAALGLALAGGLIALAGVWEFRRARTTINPLAPQRASALVQTGVFGLTRNPMSKSSREGALASRLHDRVRHPACVLRAISGQFQGR